MEGFITVHRCGFSLGHREVALDRHRRFLRVQPSHGDGELSRAQLVPGWHLDQHGVIFQELQVQQPMLLKHLVDVLGRNYLHQPEVESFDLSVSLHDFI